MADVLSPGERSACMAAIRSRDTVPEMRVRRLVHGLGCRFRLGGCGLPGKPDLVLRRHRTVIFVHGCFWHQHNCSDGRLPLTRKSYWHPKLVHNVRRDHKNSRILRRMGWRVITIWECQTAAPNRLLARLGRALGKTTR